MENRLWAFHEAKSGISSRRSGQARRMKTRRTGFRRLPAPTRHGIHTGDDGQV